MFGDHLSNSIMEPTYDPEYSIEALFEQDYKDAQAYHRRALQFRNEGQAHSLVFNIASVALERYLVALCELHGMEPMNHNFITLMITVDKFLEVPRCLSKDIKSLDQIFGICFLEDYFHGSPLPADAEKTLHLCDQVKKLFDLQKIDELHQTLENMRALAFK
jgi:hypothetical protein